MRTFLKAMPVIALALFLSACGPETPPPVAYQAPAQVWQDDASHNLVHVPSGVVFPYIAGAFQRGKLTDFAPDGSDIGVPYWGATLDKNGRKPELTLYLTYKAAMSVKEYFAMSYDAIEKRVPGIPLAYEGTFKPEGKNPPAGPIRMYNLRLDGQPYRTGLWAAKRGPWLLLARFTYLDQPDPLTQQIKTELTEAMKQTGSGNLSFDLTRTTEEGVPIDMEAVVAAMKAVRWGGNP